MRNARSKLNRACHAAACAATMAAADGSLAYQPADGHVALSGQSDLSRLVDLAAQRLHLNLDYDAAALKGAVTLRLEGAVSDQELWLLVNRLLASRGFTTVRTPGRGSYSVVKLADAAALTRSDSPPPAAGEPPAGFRAVTVRVEHKAPKDAIEAVSKLLSKPGGAATALGDSGLILIADLSDRVDAAVALLHLIDTPAGAITAEEVPLKHVSAQSLVTLSAQLAAKREAVGGSKVPGDLLPLPGGTSLMLVCPVEARTYWISTIERLDRRPDVSVETYAFRTFAIKDVASLLEQTVKGSAQADDRFRVVTDELTGTLIVTATREQHDQIRALAERLNQSPVLAARPVRAFTIKNRSVHDVQAVLEQLLNAGVLGPATPESAPQAEGDLAPWPPVAAGNPKDGAGPLPHVEANAAPPAAAHLTAPGQRTQPGSAPPPVVTFASDASTNLLIAMGEPHALTQIEELLKTLDVRQPQVMLEVLIVSLNHGQTLDLGVELEKLTVIGDARVRLASLFGLGSRGPTGDRTVGDGSGGTALVLSPGDFAVVVRALQTINDGRSLSMPRILVANNQQGTLDSVLDVPFANTNASNTVTTTSFGGSRPAGTQVSIKPQIASGGQLTLDYSVSLSSFTGAASSANLPPPRQENKVQSVATIPDGYTVALGAIELNTDGATTSQVPLLAQIPIIGEAFKNRSKNSSNTRFYVFIRAGVLRSGSFEDLKYLSDSAASAAGVDDGFPVVDPRVIR